jgi:hypothetical protein
MLLFLFKLFTTPILLAAATLVSRRFGPSVAGWLVGLPLTSGPIAIFLAIDNGTAFSSDAALGSLEGTSAQACFVMAYCRSAQRLPWPAALALGCAAFAGSGALLQALEFGAGLLTAIAIGALCTGLWLTPAPARPPPPTRPVRGDLVVRMVIAALLVVAITSIARTVGAQASGLFATFPLFAALLGVFAHRQSGPVAALHALRGLLFGLYAFVGFFLAVHMLVVPLGIAASIGCALVIALAIHWATFVVLRRSHPA